MIKLEATIEQQPEAGTCVLRVLVQGLRVEVSTHESLPMALEALQSRLLSHSYGNIETVQIGDIVFKSLEAAVEYLRTIGE